MSEQIVKLLISYERTIAKLYSVCASKYPEHASFWNTLSQEEENHARIIEKLYQQIDGHTVFLENNRFKVRPLEISIEYSEEVIERAEQGMLTLLEALSISHSIETSVIESYYHTLFGGKSSNLNLYLNKLHEESKDHRNRLKDLLEKERSIKT